MKIIKGPAALKKYGEKAAGGAIEVNNVKNKSNLKKPEKAQKKSRLFLFLLFQYL